MKQMKLIDEIIKEPLGGAHTDREKTFKSVSDAIVKSYNEFKNLSPKELVKKRMDKYSQMGVFKG
jgi:acetyl-CoA carboxylase carboxyl transferase subunit alpha